MPENAPSPPDPAPPITLERGADGVALLTLNRPPLNLFTLTMTRAFDARLREVAADPSIRALVLTGAGERAFGAGSDIREFPDYLRAGTVISGKLRFENEVFNRLEDLPQPTIAALRGVALGGGLEIALCCDFRVGADDLRLGSPEVKLGVYPGSGGLLRLPRLVGEARAKELLYLGDFIGADTALHWGLLHRKVPAAEVVPAALALAGELARRPAAAVRIMKRGLRELAGRPRDEAVEASFGLSARRSSPPRTPGRAWPPSSGSGRRASGTVEGSTSLCCSRE